MQAPPYLLVLVCRLRCCSPYCSTKLVHASRIMPCGIVAHAAKLASLMSACVTGSLTCSFSLPATYMHSGHVTSLGLLLVCLGCTCSCTGSPSTSSTTGSGCRGRQVAAAWPLRCPNCQCNWECHNMPMNAVSVLLHAQDRRLPPYRSCHCLSFLLQAAAGAEMSTCRCTSQLNRQTARGAPVLGELPQGTRPRQSTGCRGQR